MKNTIKCTYLEYLKYSIAPYNYPNSEILNDKLCWDSLALGWSSGLSLKAGDNY